jgi:cytochrome bd-type quinol oxidase subunit 2
MRAPRSSTASPASRRGHGHARGVASAAAPEASLSFFFWGAGLFVLPVIAIYTAVVYWVFRGKLRRGHRG